MATGLEALRDPAAAHYEEGKEAEAVLEADVTSALQRLKRLMDFKQYASAYELCAKILRVEPHNKLLLEYRDVLARALEEGVGEDTESESDDDDNDSMDDDEDEGSDSSVSSSLPSLRGRGVESKR